MAEEIHQPEHMIPKSIMITVLIGLVSSLCYTIAMCFSISDLKGVTGSTTGVPILELYYQATRRFGGTVGLHILFLLTGFGCLVACRKLSYLLFITIAEGAYLDTWQARLAWSFSRDRGLPGSRWWSVVHSTTGLLTCVWLKS